jgi:hypothetical protein
MEQRADMKKTVLGLSLGLGSWVLGIPAWAQAVLDTGLSAEILNQTVTTPFRRPDLLRESSRPVYVITRQQMREQGSLPFPLDNRNFPFTTLMAEAFHWIL